MTSSECENPAETFADEARDWRVLPKTLGRTSHEQQISLRAPQASNI